MFFQWIKPYYQDFFLERESTVEAFDESWFGVLWVDMIVGRTDMRHLGADWKGLRAEVKDEGRFEAWEVHKLQKANLSSHKAYFRPERAEFKSERADLGPEMADSGSENARLGLRRSKGDGAQKMISSCLSHLFLPSFAYRSINRGRKLSIISLLRSRMSWKYLLSVLHCEMFM